LPEQYEPITLYGIGFIKTVKALLSGEQPMKDLAGKALEGWTRQQAELMTKQKKRGLQP